MVSGDSRDQRGPHAPSLQAGTLSDTSPFSLGPGLAQAVATEMLLVPVPPRLTVHSAITPGALGNTPHGPALGGTGALGHPPAPDCSGQSLQMQVPEGVG